MATIFHHALSALQRRLSHRRAFASFRDWRITLYDSLLRYSRNSPLPGRGKITAIHLNGISAPIYLRLGSSDGFVMEEIFISGVYDCITSADLGEMNSIVDLGANIGLSVRLWLEKYPKARIIAVEPDHQNMEMCRLNVGDEVRARVSLIEACVGSAPGVARLDRSAEECAIRMIPTSADAADSGDTADKVLVMTLEQILTACNLHGPIDLLKCDIEGAEEPLFTNCSPWIAQVRNLMIELHPPYGEEQFLTALHQSGHPFTLKWRGLTAGNPLLLLSR